jgi:hypothetical protein
MLVEAHDLVDTVAPCSRMCSSMENSRPSVCNPSEEPCDICAQEVDEPCETGSMADTCQHHVFG